MRNYWKLLKPNEKFKLGILTKIESKPTQQIKEVGRNNRGRSGNWKKKTGRNWKKKEKRNWGEFVTPII